MILAANLGMPRIGAKRELKKALESFWKGEATQDYLETTAFAIRKFNWEAQVKAGIDIIPSNDFSLYDQVLDTAIMLGAIPERFRGLEAVLDYKTYFAMARGSEGAAAMEMTKWFDTNYHYIVPEVDSSTQFKLTINKPLAEYLEAKALGINTRPCIIGPVTFLKLAKTPADIFKVLLDRLIPVYNEIFRSLKDNGVDWLQIDEPALVLDLQEHEKEGFARAYEAFTAGGAPKIMLTTYFGGLEDNLDLASKLPVSGLHVDLTRAPAQLDAVLQKLSATKTLSLGLIDGRNIWRADLDKAVSKALQASKKFSGDIIITPSCSLLHSPVCLSFETALDAELKNWLAFSMQKLSEIAVITKAINGGEEAVQSQLDESRAALASRSSSSRIHNPAVKKRVSSITPDMLKRQSPFDKRINAQAQKIPLPLLPTTTIGSFPQTTEVRAARAAFKAGQKSEAEYNQFLKAETEKCIRQQEELGIDMLVHGEFERNDMVEYFGEQLAGFAFTLNGWVQSYGSRCVKPPIIYGDVSRPKPMTVEWSAYAQSLTNKPMKGMLTGPVTILQWSFVRDDQARSETCKQIAFSIRDEVVDLEKAGIRAIQIDEPALREGLPLRKSAWQEYLTWAVDCFRLSCAAVRDETQVHTHMCYSEFNDIISSIAAMDADVISIETSRSKMELLDAFVNFKYPNQIGPGVYDIHSPRVPAMEEMENLLRKALEVLSPSQIWINPDCGLKTRGWKETLEALRNMTESAKKLRAELAAKDSKQAASA